MQDEKYISVFSDKKKIVLDIRMILYVVMTKDKAEIHVSDGRIFKTWMSLVKLEKHLGDGFIRVHRGCLVSVRAIHDITDKINLSNGESLEYTIRKKKIIIDQFASKQKSIIRSFTGESLPVTEEEYRRYYGCLDNLPFAFADIEMKFNEERHAIDWIFRYGNYALAKLEKKPLDQLIGNSFGSLFSNMDSKWLRSYERATIYGEMLEIIDYSPEIDTYLKVICFPTFRGHCGCILFDISEIKFSKNSDDVEKALMLYFKRLMEKND